MAEPRITQTTPYDSPGTSLPFADAKDLGESPTGSPQRPGAQIEVQGGAVGYLQIGDFRPISRYIAETVQDGDIVTMYIRLIGNLMGSIEWRYCQ